MLVSLFVALVSTAQNPADITGTVTDTAGAVLPGVTVTITGPERRETVTSERGVFMFRNVLPGSYEARFELAGFRTSVMKVIARAGATERLRVGMAIRGLQESVEVSSDSRQGKASAREAESGILRGGGAGGGVSVGVGGGIAGGHAPYLPGRYAGPFHTEAYDSLDENPFRRVSTEAVSTFSIDVDTASYANVRRFLNTGALPPAGAVRIEELINYFRFAYPQPQHDRPFSVTTELADCPWNPKHRLALVGLQGRDMPDERLPPRNLVFLIDVSGSMDSPDKLPLVRHALRMLAETLNARDRVAIVVYAGASGLVLPSTAGDHKAAIGRAIADLGAGGSTNGAAGITLAYRVAREHFMAGGVNRVVLATDGDFNVGVTSQDQLVRLIEQERASGIFLSVLGVGTGNLKDSTMEKLADKGNGNYSYLDSLNEARKVLVKEAGGTLVTIAKDVKIQVEFNPATVSAYRLIGYENRMLRREDFNDDKKDAGEIGAGHSVTAVYEIVPAGVEMDLPAADPLKYQRDAAPAPAAASNELATVKLRYKAPQSDTSQLVSVVVRNEPQPLSTNLGFASAVAEFGMLLRQSKHAGNATLDAAVARARRFRGEDPEGNRAEFVKLVELAASLRRMQLTP
jgi:Ca-activated chloride channel family protein